MQNLSRDLGLYFPFLNPCCINNNNFHLYSTCNVSEKGSIRCFTEAQSFHSTITWTSLLHLDTLTHDSWSLIPHTSLYDIASPVISPGLQFPRISNNLFQSSSLQFSNISAFLHFWPLEQLRFQSLALPWKCWRNSKRVAESKRPDNSWLQWVARDRMKGLKAARRPPSPSFKVFQYQLSPRFTWRCQRILELSG